jgi:septal ring-binding cell division protein DamX
MNAGNPDLKVTGLDVLTTGLNLAELDLHGGEGLWDEVARFTRDSRLEDLVDRCMGGRAAPRLWAIMEAPGSGPGAAAAGLGVARVLADRGQAVALLDVDEKEPRLTRWLGRVEQEGWIDMVRFGASLHAASAPLPSDNRRGSVIGVGSFSPTGVTPDEVGDLLGRLRHQADDLVMVLPAKLRSQPWLEAAHMRLLCWDLLARDRADTETIVSELERMGAAPEAVLGFGVEEYLAIQDRLREDVVGAETEPSPEPSPEPTAALTPDLESEAEPEPVGAASPSSAEAEDEAEEEPAASGRAGARRGRSSGLFVFAAVAAVAALVLIGVFVVGQRQAPDGRPTEVATARVDGAPGAADVLPPPPAPVADGEGEDPGAAATGTITDEPLPKPAGPEAGADDELATGDAGAGVAADENEGVEPPGEGGDGAATPAGDLQPADDLEPAPLPGPAAPAAPVQEQEDAGPAGFDPAPFREPVGEAGWALWLFSLPSEADADREVRELARRGLVAEHRAVEIKDRGRWYRVYTGSFATRAQASAAAPALRDRLAHDWAVPARF